MTLTPETCAACRFDASQYDLQDTLGTLRALTNMWSTTIEGLPDSVLGARPTPAVWSAAEYLRHSCEAVAAARQRLHAILTDEAAAMPEAALGVDGTPELVAAALDRLEEEIGRLHDEATSLRGERDARWRRTATVGGETVDAAAVLRHAIHEVTHHLWDVGRGLHLLGAGAPTQEGRVAQLATSDGGVPKRPIEVADVGDRGIVGDRQASRLHHGRPLQALCLWSLDVIDALRAEGHPIAPGSAGENVTISGVDWTTIRPGTQLLIGEVLVEISAWATPCKKNAPWFANRDFKRMDHDRHPGWSRAYAWVREPGTVRQGDSVIVEP